MYFYGNPANEVNYLFINLPLILLQGSQGDWSQSQVALGEGGIHPGQSAVYHRADIKRQTAIWTQIYISGKFKVTN